jgi:flavin reductase (DIM6/NTAB) family NADH-FMN oxidoreductase RutF
VLLDALAVFDCVVDEMMVAHSHAAMIGEIKAVLLSPRNEAPLLYSDGQYTTLADLGETA